MTLKALICLDDQTLCAGIAARFEQLGWRCFSKDFLATALWRQPDLVVLDARADFLLKALKADPRTAQLPVVVIGFDVATKARCLQLGALAWLSRPLEPGALDAFTSFLEHGRSGAAEATPTSPPPRPAPAARSF